MKSYNPVLSSARDHVMATTTEPTTASIWQRMLWGTKLTVGVNNAFDRQPPSVLGAFNDKLRHIALLDP